MLLSEIGSKPNWHLKILSADDSVCNEIQKSSNTNRTNAITPAQTKLHEKTHFTNALNGSAQKNLLGMSFIILFISKNSRALCVIDGL